MNIYQLINTHKLTSIARENSLQLRTIHVYIDMFITKHTNFQSFSRLLFNSGVLGPVGVSGAGVSGPAGEISNK